MVFYRKYRPQKFSDLVGQDHVSQTLLSQLEKGKFGHGYLFFGPRGTGKTSAARIFAKAVNCKVYNSELTVDGKKKSVNRERSTVNKFGEPCNKCQSCLSIINGSNLDLIEIDAASNRNIDDIRDLREKIKLSPVASRFKVYIIDEVHMLTKEAFNALLKTLEEPPSHAIFILCTTEINKLPQTILSRVQKFNFQRASDEAILKAIARIVKAEGLKLEKESLLAIARAADGSFRDAISLLDQVSTSEKSISAKEIQKLSQASDWTGLHLFIQELTSKNLKEAVTKVEEISRQGGDIAAFCRESILFLEKLLLIKLSIENLGLELEKDQVEKMRKLSENISFADLQILLRLLLVAEGDMKNYPLPQISLILAVCKFSLPAWQESKSKELTQEDNQVTKFKDKENVKPEIDVKKVSTPKERVNPKELKFWGEFLNKVRPKNTHLMAILKATRPVEFNGDILTLEVFYRFHKEKLEEPKIISILEQILFDVSGQKIKIKFLLAKKDVIKNKTQTAENIIDIGENDLERVANEIFSK